VLNDYTHLWLYIVGPLAGAVLAVGFAVILRGQAPGGTEAARGTLDS
jgi:aquaporin Z